MHGHSHVRYSSPSTEDRLGRDFDACGRLDIRALQNLGVPHAADFYVCGPPVFMSDLTKGLTDWGIAASRIHTELFGSVHASTPGIAAPPMWAAPHQPAGSPAAGPLVSFARSGLNVHWGPAFHSVLELAEACDIPVRWSCRTGVCHTCETGLVGGEVVYGPAPIDAPGEGNVLICCCQPRGNIVIDL
jgi:ferredoxin